MINRINRYSYTNQNLRNVDINDKFYKEYEYKYLHNEGVYENKDQYLKKKPFEKIYKLTKKICFPQSKRKLFGIIYSGDLKRYKNITTLSLKNVSIYKALDFFPTIATEKKYRKTNRRTPTWYGSLLNVYRGVSRRNGGICAYICKSIKILVIDCKTIKHIINLLINKYTVNGSINFRGKKKSIKYITQLLLLSSCSNGKDFDKQLKIYDKLFNYNNQVWLTDKVLGQMLCNVEFQKDNYFAIVKKKGLYNYDFAHILKYINKVFCDNYYSGYLVQYNFTPYFFTGITSEELILFDNMAIERNIKDPYDWTNYKHILEFKVNTKFKLDVKYGINNTGFYLNKYYNLKYNSSKNKKYINSKSIIFIDCGKFKYINTNDSKSIIIKQLSNFIKFMGDNTYVLVNTNNTNLNISKMQLNKYKNLIIFEKKIINKKKFNLEYVYIYVPGKHRPTFEESIHISKLNYQKGVNMVKNKMKTNILIVNANISKYNPLINYLKNNKYKYHNCRNSVYITNKNHIFVKNYKAILLDFGYLLFRPIIFIKNNKS